MEIIEHLKLLPDSYAKDLEYELNNDFFPWYYNPSTIDHDYDITDTNIVPTFQYTHQIYSTNSQPSYLYQFVKPVVYFIEEKLNLKVKQIDRIKANSLHPMRNFNFSNYNPPHWDNDPRRQSNRLSCVYYVNNSDGDTRIFDKKYPEENKNLKVINSFTPKQGFATIFNSDYWHAGSNPITYNRRIVLNFVFEVTT